MPIPVSVVSGTLMADAGAFNVNRLKELVPTVQFYSSNPRNSTINIRGLGSPFGLTNDGIDPGVGFYIDGVFFARPAAATLDFIDLEQTEVLRGPQGTLYGKNATAGAINVTTRKPTFVPESQAEFNLASLDLVQAKGSVAGPLSDTVAGRVSFSGTTRRGTLDHVTEQDDLNGLSNLGLRGQMLFAPSARTAVTLAADNTRQRPARLRAGRGRRRADPAAREPSVPADCRGPELRPAQLQRVRSPDATRTRPIVPTRISAARRSRSNGPSGPAGSRRSPPGATGIGIRRTIATSSACR